MFCIYQNTYGMGGWKIFMVCYIFVFALVNGSQGRAIPNDGEAQYKDLFGIGPYNKGYSFGFSFGQGFNGGFGFDDYGIALGYRRPGFGCNGPFPIGPYY